MKKSLVLVLMFCFSLVGCVTEKNDFEAPYDKIGIITEIDVEKNRILVEEKNTNLIWISLQENDSIENYKEGQEIGLWIDGLIAESAPPQAMALKIKIITQKD